MLGLAPPTYMFQVTQKVLKGYIEPDSEINFKSKIKNLGNSSQNISKRQNFSNTQILDNIRYKFLTKYDSSVICIKNYLRVLDRWRVGNAASDAKTIIMRLQNFKNISLANNSAETLSYEANVDFKIFCNELTTKLRNSKREKNTETWYLR